MKAFAAILLAAIAAAAPAAEPRALLAPLLDVPEGTKTTGGHIVVFKDGVEDSKSVFESFGLDGLDSLFSGVLNGFSGTFGTAALALIRADPRVAYVEPDVIFHTTAQQNGAPYGLAISSQQGPLSPSQQTTYFYESGAGSGVTAYIVDTGINAGHQDFGGRAIFAANFVSGSPNTDENGHGTHCAGTIGGATFGIAKSVTLKGVKVLGRDGSGSTTGIVNGINWAVNDCRGKCVISMSLGGGRSTSLNNAAAGAYNRGLTVVVAAGNEGQNACNVSPASEPSAITVGAIDTNYNKPSFSNFGSCVDVFAPGVNVRSAWIGSSTATNTISGTSMATPHVAGIAAYYLSIDGVSSPSQVRSLIDSYAQYNLIPNSNGSPNKIANNGYWL